MKLIGKLFVLLLIIPVFLIALITGTFRYRVLDENFLHSAYSEGAFYEVLKGNIQKVTRLTLYEQEGAKNLTNAEKRLIDTQIETYTKDLSREDLQLFVEENLTTITRFLKGQQKDLSFYVPFDKLGFINEADLSSSIRTGENTIDLTGLVNFRTPQGTIYPTFINPLNAASYMAGLFFAASLIFVLLLFAYFKIGGSLASLSTPLFVVSALTLGTSLVLGLVTKNVGTDLVNGQEPAEVLLGTFAPPVLRKTAEFWQITAISLFVVGLLFLLTKFLKPKAVRSS